MNSSVHINRVRVQILSERHKYGTKSGNWIKIDGLDTNFYKLFSKKVVSCNSSTSSNVNVLLTVSLPVLSILFIFIYIYVYTFCWFNP